MTSQGAAWMVPMIGAARIMEYTRSFIMEYARTAEYDRDVRRSGRQMREARGVG